MENLFKRDGTEFTGTVLKTADGDPCFSYPVHCGRCGGAGGSDSWRFTGWTCFECRGTGGRATKFALLYTAEKLAKLNATQAKREATKAAKAAAKDAEFRNLADVRRAEFLTANPDVEFLTQYEGGNEFLKSLAGALAKWGRLTDPQLAAVRKSVERDKANAERAATAEYVGTVGERRLFTITVDRAIPVESIYGTKYIVLARDEAGNAIVYRGNSEAIPGVGETGTVKATVAEHKEYNGLKQTIISRPAAIEERKAA